jgi:hypothetical protein
LSDQSSPTAQSFLKVSTQGATESKFDKLSGGLDLLAVLAGVLGGISVIAITRMISGPTRVDFIGGLFCAAWLASIVTKHRQKAIEATTDPRPE